MNKGIKKTVAVIFGGVSVEHEVSVVSARSVLSNLDRERFSVFPVFIDKQGIWHHVEDAEIRGEGRPVTGNNGYLLPITGNTERRGFIELENGTLKAEHKIDVVFPVLHGTYGEDGSIQGLLELMYIPYVGSAVLGSALSMDKIVMKSILREKGLPVVDFIAFSRKEWSAGNTGLIKDIESTIGFPCFVKSADLGSSVGISKVKYSGDLGDAIDNSFEYSNRVLVERAVEKNREIEVSVLGDQEPKASVPGEIIPEREFYDYEAKYRDSSTKLVIPAKLDPSQTQRLMKLAVECFNALDCSGMARVDFLINGNTGEIFISELNTIPGFTSISMYPKLWEASGLGYKELLSSLVDLAFYKHEQKHKLNTNLGIV